MLTESIAYAAQQFGIALYDSLTKSQERLANQVNYIIDKNSIRFNSKYLPSRLDPTARTLLSCSFLMVVLSAAHDSSSYRSLCH